MVQSRPFQLHDKNVCPLFVHALLTRLSDEAAKAEGKEERMLSEWCVGSPDDVRPG